MNVTHSQKPRIALYGIGQFGLTLAKIALDKGFPVVAAVNRAGNKVGKDLGTLIGLNRELGVVVQDCEDVDYNAVDADICVVATTDYLELNLPAYKRLLEAGINVISHATEGYYPFGINPDIAKDIDELAKDNNVTYTGTGIWDMSRIWAGMLVSAPCTAINGFFHRSITDAQRLGPKLMRKSGVGISQETFKDKFSIADGSGGGLYKTIPHQVLDALGYTVINVTERREPVLSDKPYYCELINQTFEPGVCLGTRMIAVAQTAEGPSAEAHIELRVFHEGETEQMMWRVDGSPTSKITVERDDSVYASAATMFNRIPDVIAAEPGIKVVSELGMMKHTALI